MPVSQGSGGGYMPGLSLRAWALVAANGTMLKGMNAAMSKTGAGAYTLTLQDGAAGAGTIINVRAMVNASHSSWNLVSKVGAAVSYLVTNNLVANGADAVHHVEVWE